MDFTLGEELEAVADLARRIFADHCGQDRIRAAERSATGMDETLWKELADAGLLGAALPETASGDGSGAGLGIAGLCVLLIEQGRAVAPVPVWPAVVAALALAEHGAPAQRAALLPGAAAGTARLTVALEEFGAHDPSEPRCAAVRAERTQGGEAGWLLTGTKAAVPAAGAGHVLVSARTDGGPGLFLLDADAAGVTWERADTTAHDAAANLLLDGAPAEPVGDPAHGRDVLGAVLGLARVALAAVQAGVAEGALDLAARHLAGREQFGRPLATFQAAQHQLADCYIEIDALRVCLWHAVSLLAAGEPAAETGRAVLVAKWWSDEGGLNVVHRVQHLHGGVGVDVDHPVHRYFLWGKQISGTLGGASADLALLGAAL